MGSTWELNFSWVGHCHEQPSESRRSGNFVCSFISSVHQASVFRLLYFTAYLPVYYLWASSRCLSHPVILANLLERIRGPWRLTNPVIFLGFLLKAFSGSFSSQIFGLTLWSVYNEVTSCTFYLIFPENTAPNRQAIWVPGNRYLLEGLGKNWPWWVHWEVLQHCTYWGS